MANHTRVSRRTSGFKIKVETRGGALHNTEGYIVHVQLKKEPQIYFINGLVDFIQTSCLHEEAATTQRAKGTDVTSGTKVLKRCVHVA